MTGTSSARKRMKLRPSFPAESTRSSSPSFTLQRRWFHFHGVAAAARDTMAAQIQACDGELWPPADAAVAATIARVFVVTDYWVDWLPTQQSLHYKRKQAVAAASPAVTASTPMVPMIVITPFWLHEVLRCEKLLPPDAHVFFAPPPVPSFFSDRRRWIQYPMQYEDAFGSLPSGDHRMRLPCSPQNAWKLQVPLWPYYVAYLQMPMTNTQELCCVLNQITGLDQRRLTNLETVIEELLTRQERELFFQQLLPKMVELVLHLPSMFPESPSLLTPLPLTAASRRETTSTRDFSKLEVLALVCACFFSVFPAQDEHKKQRKGENGPPSHSPIEFPFFSMSSLFASPRTSSVADSKTQKLRCVLQYFLRVVPLAIRSPEQLMSQRITFTRVAVHAPANNDHELQPHEILNALKPTDSLLALTDVRCESNRWIEALDDHLQIDFANEYAGGGVFSGGCVQEEIRFVLSPELFVACLVFAKLEPHEAFVIHGTERYSYYSGYGFSFKFTGDFQDATSIEVMPSDACQPPKYRRQCVISGIDAFDYGGNRSAGAQYTRAHIWRDLVKALAGFVYPDASTKLWPIATGNWGCGVFRGDPELKFLIQWLAASLCSRDLVYVLFERDQDLHAKIESIVNEFNEFIHPDARTLFQIWIAEFLFDTTETVVSSNLRRGGHTRGFSILAIATAFVQRKKRMTEQIPTPTDAGRHSPANVDEHGDGDTVMASDPEPPRQPKQLQQTRMDSFFKSSSK